jgi:hypothetical protein
MIELWLGVVIAVSGLSWVEHLVRRGGGRRWPTARRRGVTIGLLTLLAALTAAPMLGLRYGLTLVPRIVAGGLCRLLLVYLLQLLPRLRPLLGRSLPRRPALVFFALPAVVYLAITPWASSQRPPDGDEPYYLLVAHSLAHDFDAELTNNYAAEDSRDFVGRVLEAQPHDPRGPNGEMYSRHNVLLPAVLAPAYRVGGKYGALSVMCLFAAALAWMTLRLARHQFANQPGPTLIAYFILAFTSPLLLYSHQVWVEIPAALLLAIALDAVWTITPEQARQPRHWLPLAVPLLLLPLLKIRFLLVAVPLLPMLAWRFGRRSRRVVILALAGCVALAAAILAFNQLRFGNPLKYHDLTRLDFYWNDLSRYPQGFLGLFFDISFGLFASAPIWALLLAPGRGKSRPLAQLCWVMAPYILILVPRSEWYGAWSPPFRYGCVALPLFALVLIPGLVHRRGAGARLLLGALLAPTALLTTLWTARPGWTYNIAHGRSHLVDILSQTQEMDIARFLPSGVRPNLALWLWPLVVVATIALLWRWPKRPSTGAFWLGATLPVVGLAGLVVASHSVPTRLIEAEDPYIVRDGGAIWPEDWVVGRTRFRSGWRLRRADTLTIPVVPGGAYCSIELDLKRFGKPRPHIRVRPVDGSAALARVGESRNWTTVHFDDLRWPPDARSLEISLQMSTKEDLQAAILLDRVRLSWSDERRDERRAFASLGADQVERRSDDSAHGLDLHAAAAGQGKGRAMVDRGADEG